MNRDALAFGFLQHHKMAHVPVQDAWSLQVPQVFKLNAQGTAGEIEQAGKADDVGQRSASHRN